MDTCSSLEKKYINSVMNYDMNKCNKTLKEMNKCKQDFEDYNMNLAKSNKSFENLHSWFIEKIQLGDYEQAEKILNAQYIIMYERKIYNCKQKNKSNK